MRQPATGGPFALVGLNSDNGSECGRTAINQELYSYCRREGIKFTRSRPYAVRNGEERSAVGGRRKLFCGPPLGGL